jgi:hypothetical protein
MTKEKVFMTVTQSELVSVLNEVKNPTFCNVVMVTEPRMNKKGNDLYGRVTKHKTGRILIGMDYEKRVNNNLEKEGQERGFVSQESKVGTHVNKCVLWNENKQKFYLFHEWFKEVKPSTEIVVDGGTTIQVDGVNVVSENPIEQMLLESYQRTFEQYLVKSNSYGGQGLDREVQVLSVSLDNVKVLSHNGVYYTLLPNEVLLNV